MIDDSTPDRGEKTRCNVSHNDSPVKNRLERGGRECRGRFDHCTPEKDEEGRGKNGSRLAAAWKPGGGTKTYFQQ